MIPAARLASAVTSAASEDSSPPHSMSLGHRRECGGALSLWNLASRQCPRSGVSHALPRAHRVAAAAYARLAFMSRHYSQRHVAPLHDYPKSVCTNLEGPSCLLHKWLNANALHAFVRLDLEICVPKRLGAYDFHAFSM